MQFTLSVLLVFIAVFLILLSTYSFKFRSLSHISKPFAALMFALSVYAAGYAAELQAPTLQDMVYWSTVQYFGISFIPSLWLILIAQYAGAPFSGRKRLFAALLAGSCVTLFGALSDPWLHLKYATVSTGMQHGIRVLLFTRGPLYFFHVGYTFCALAAGIVFLVHILMSTGQPFRKTLLLMTAGAAVPFIDFLVYLTDTRFSGIDTIPFSMFFSVLCSWYALFSENLFDAAPVARSIVFEMIPDAVVVTDSAGTVIDYNKAACALFPDITSGVNPIPYLQRSGGDCQSEFQTDIVSGGQARKFSCPLSSIPGVHGRNEPAGSIFLFKDETGMTRLLEKFQELATVDPLTGLYNRRYFMDKTRQVLQKMEAAGGVLSFIIADLDLFKQLNDTQGHLSGDKAIQDAAAAFTSAMHGQNTAARFGGEEFICLLPDTCAEEAFKTAEDIRIKISAIPYPADAQTARGTPLVPYLTASFGVASTDVICGEQTITSLIRKADEALYHSKSAGRNRTTIG